MLQSCFLLHAHIVNSEFYKHSVLLNSLYQDSHLDSKPFELDLNPAGSNSTISLQFAAHNYFITRFVKSIHETCMIYHTIHSL